jgi:hypothetical protein
MNTMVSFYCDSNIVIPMVLLTRHIYLLVIRKEDIDIVYYNEPEPEQSHSKLIYTKVPASLIDVH